MKKFKLPNTPDAHAEVLHARLAPTQTSCHNTTMWGLFRLFLALTVVVGHARMIVGFTHGHFSAADMAVESFFTISGYLITKAIQRNYNDGFSGFIRFWQNRALRLLPPYWVALAVALAIAPVYFAPHIETALPHGIGWLAAFTMIGQTGLITWNPFAAPLGVSWSLSVEIFYYAVLSIWAARSRNAALFFLILSLGAALTFGIHIEEVSMYFGILWQALPFAMGATLAWVAPRDRIAGFYGYALVFGAACYVSLGTPDNIGLYLCAPVACAAILACESLPQRRIGRFMADLSYPVYLIQFPAMALLRGLHGWAFVIAAPFATVGAGIVINRLVEAPITRVRARIRSTASSLEYVARLSAIPSAGTQPVRETS